MAQFVKNLNIPIAKTSFTEEEYLAVRKTLESGWIVQGPNVKEFEEQWSHFTGADHSIAVTSCTTALHLSLFALGLQPGDEVIVPAFTWIATANVVEHIGAKVVFCDIDAQTLNIDNEKIEALITNKTKAIIPVHLFGLAADMNRINKIAEKYDLFVIEDAACGFGSMIDGKHVGNFGQSGCFSFHPRKAITTGEGGMITANDEKFAQQLRSLRDHGASISDLQRHHGAKPYLLPDFKVAGFNYRMTDIQASIGITQMHRANNILEARRVIAQKFDGLFKEFPWLSPIKQSPGFSHGYQSYVCWYNKEEVNITNCTRIHGERNRLMEYLQSKGISTRPGTHAVPALDYYREKYHLSFTDYQNAWLADQCTIAFPLFPSITEKEIDYIYKALNSFNI